MEPMRQGQQHRRGRGRNNNGGGGNGHHQSQSINSNRKGQNPLTRSFESNGPDVKIRGTPAHVAEKYVALARDAQSAGDPVLAENYLQHAEHYNRIIMAYREQQGIENPPMAAGMMRRQSGDPSMDGEFSDDDGDDFNSDGGSQPVARGQEPQPGGFDQPRFDDRPPRDNNNQRHQQNRNQNNRDRQQGDRQDSGEPRRFQNDRPDYRNNENRGDGRSDNRRDFQPQRPESRPENRPENRPERFDRNDRNGERNFDRGGDNQGGGGRSEGDNRPQRFDRPERTERPERIERPERVERTEPVDRQPAAVAPVAETVTAEPIRRREPRAAVPSHEQPEFLRRPVRRPRREAVAEGADDKPATDETSGNE